MPAQRLHSGRSEAETRILTILKSAQESSGVSQNEVARRAGISESQLSKILAGSRTATLGEIIRLCEVLGLSVTEVVREAEEG